MGSTSDQPSLRTIQTSFDADTLFSKLLGLSKQGKLAGYQREGKSETATVDAHGMPFDSDLLITHAQGEVQFELKLRQKMPIVFIVITILTIWPGVLLTDGFLFGFEWYERLMGESIKTWMWYIPLSAIPAPFAILSSLKKSKSTAIEHANETIDRIETLLTQS